MPKFFVGKSGCGGAGYIHGYYFDEPKEIETDDPAFVEALRNSLVAVEIEPEEPVQVATPTVEEVSGTTDLEDGNSATTDSEAQKPLEELTHRELTDLCKELGLSRARSKVDMVKRIRDSLDSAESKEVSVDEC